MHNDDPEKEAEEAQDADEVDDQPWNEERSVLLAKHGQDESNVDGDGHRVHADQARQLPHSQVGGVMREVVPGLSG